MPDAGIERVRSTLMRVLFLSPVGVIGGAERCLLDILWSLKSHTAVEPSLLTLGDGPLLDEARNLGVRTRLLPLPTALASFGETRPSWLDALRALSRASLAGARFGRELAGVLRREDCDLVHTHGVKAHLLAGVLTPRRAPLVVHLHDYVSERALSKRALQSLRWRNSTAIAISRSVADDFVRTIPGVRTELVYNAVDVARFEPGPAERQWLDDLSGSPAKLSAFTFGLVATYADWKGHDVVIRAAAELKRAEPALAFRCYLIGGPIYSTAGSQRSRAELEALAAECGVADEVAFVPFQREVARVYRALDVVVHASTRREPFGLTIAEAMACGRPVIAARGGGSEELFDNGIDGVGVAAGDPTALAGALLQLAGDRAFRDRLAAAARSRAIERFDRSRLGAQIEVVYRAALNGGEGSGG